ncbi:MAG: hypothetical protein AB7M12_04515 [Hyphomonadaceae bacterium]
MSPPPPAAKKIEREIVQLGRARSDNYAWMKDENWQAVLRDPSQLRSDIRAHLEAENAYSAAVMAETAGLQAVLAAEMRARIKEDDSTVPEPDGPWEYFIRYETGAQHPQHVRARRGGGEERVLIDGDALAKAAGGGFFKIGRASHSPDHTLYAYAVDAQGSEVWRIHVRDLAAGEDLPYPIEECAGDFCFSPCASYIFWIWRDQNGRPRKVFRRPARGGADTLVYEEADEGFFLHLAVSESRAFILIGCGDHETSETRLIPAGRPEAEPVVFHPRETALIYRPTHWDGGWRILTNADGAVDFKIVSAPEDATGRAHWRDLIPHAPGRYIEELFACRDHLVRLERVEALPRIVVRARTDGAEHVIAEPEEAYALALSPGLEFDTSVLRYRYNSPTTPPRTYDYDKGARVRARPKTQ